MSKPRILRIATVSHSLNLLLKGQLKYVSKNGFNIIIASSYDNDIRFIESREQVIHYSLPLNRKLSPILDLIALFKTIKLILKLKPNIVHTHSPKAGIVGMLAAFLCRTPIKIHTVAGLPLMEARGFKKHLLIYVERLTYLCADYIIPNSNNLKVYIEQYIYKDSQKIKVIGAGSSNGIDLEYLVR